MASTFPKTFAQWRLAASKINRVLAQPDYSASPIHSEDCRACGKPMHFAKSFHSEAEPTVRHSIFVCDCGVATDQIALVSEGAE